MSNFFVEQGSTSVSGETYCCTSQPENTRRTPFSGKRAISGRTLYGDRSWPMNLKTWISPLTMAAGKLIRILLIVADFSRLRRLKGDRTHLDHFVSNTMSQHLEGCLTGLDASLYMIDQGAGRLEIDPALIRVGLDQILGTTMESGAKNPVINFNESTLSIEGVQEYITSTISDDGTATGSGLIFGISKPHRFLRNNNGTGLGLFIINDTTSKHLGNAGRSLKML